MQIDCYGFDATSEHFRRDTREIFKIKNVNHATYICFTDNPVRCVHRIFVEGETISHTWALGAWDAAESLSYIPINETMEV